MTSRILQETAPNTASIPKVARAPQFAAAQVSSGFMANETETFGAAVAAPAMETASVGEGALSGTMPAIPHAIKVLNEQGNRELLLLVEDEREIADLAAVVLTDEGYKVIVAYDGFEALKIYQQISKQIGLVILDYFLPVMDGDAVFDELCAINPNVAVVLSSGFNEQNKLGSMLARGLRGFIPKPYTREKLLVQVRSILDVARDSAR